MGAAFVLVAATADATSDPTIVIESRTVRPGDLTFSVRLDTDTEVASTQNDIVFPPEAPIAARANGKPDCQGNPDIGKGGTSVAFEPPDCAASESCTSVRGLVLSLDTVDPIPNGSVLYSCALAAETAPGEYTLHCTNPGAADPSGTRLNPACADGSVVVEAGTVLQIGASHAVQGDIVPLEVTMHSNQSPVRIVADLLVSRATPIRGVGQPACVAGSDAVVSSFTFISGQCAPADDCTGVHAVIESASEAPLASGSVLFTCGVEIATDATPDRYAVRIADATGATAAGGPIDVTAHDGAVVVDLRPPTRPPDPTPTPARSWIEIGSVGGVPGSTVQITATLHTDEQIGGVQNDLRFDAQASVAAAAGGRPACRFGEGFTKFSGAAFQPPGCQPGIDCTGMRAVVLWDTPAAITDGTVLYTCDVAIAVDARGSLPLVCHNQLGSDPAGNARQIGCSDGRVDVVVPAATPTATPVSAEQVGDSQARGGGGCEIGAAAAPACGWFALPLALVLRRACGSALRGRAKRSVHRATEYRRNGRLVR